MNYSAILKELFSKKTDSVKYDLERMKRISVSLGNPQHTLKAIHVAGSNGKGSTCSILYSMLQEHGYKVGLYTSPHLKNFEERIRINGRCISKKDVGRLYTKIHFLCDDATFFEITTMIAFLYFLEKKCDFVVIECGLGGRLDATNVITPLLSVITSISLEHTHILGSTIKQIVFEKAGIIKERVPVVCGAKGESLLVIKKIAKERHASFTVSKKPVGTSDLFSYEGMKNLSLKNMKGEFQLYNAAVALESYYVMHKQYGIRLKESSLRDALIQSKWPGRMEYVAKNILLDGAHNEESIDVLCKELKNIKKKKVFLMGILQDKEYISMLRSLEKIAHSFIFTSVPNERSLDPHILSRYSQKPCIVIGDHRKAFLYAKKSIGSDELLVVCGSLYLIGEFSKTKMN